jgi:hypothetical protein
VECLLQVGCGMLKEALVGCGMLLKINAKRVPVKDRWT